MSTVTNYWPEVKCAKAFWQQQEAPAYRRLLTDTLDWADPGPGERWLDLGCGGGALTRAIWEKTRGEVGEIIGVDCSPANAGRYRDLQATLSPCSAGRVVFRCENFSNGLAFFPDNSFDHVVSGLSISYAESYDEEAGAWTTAAYDRLLSEVLRVLRPGGRFVFSVNVPEPSWLRVSLRSLTGVVRSGKPLRFLKSAWRMLRYGAWLKREARRGRFHYLPHPTITAKLQAAGYGKIEHRLSYAGQAYIFRAAKSSGRGGAHAR